jgi:putative transposase
VRELAATGAPIRVPVVVAPAVLNLSTQGYYKWRKSQGMQRDWDDAHLIAAARIVHAEEPGYGYRLISDELNDAGYHVSENRVARLCCVQGIFASHAKKRGKKSNPGPAPHDDLLAYVDEYGRTRHDFTASAANEKWLTDISEHPTGEGKLYYVR